MNVRAAVLLISLPSAWACASAGGGAARSAPRHEPNIISSEELQGASASNLFDAIRTLRPQWLSSRSPTMLRPQAEGNIVVYMDRVRYGVLEMLRQFPLGDVESVRYYSPSEAEGQFGLGHLQGAIQIVIRRQR